MRQDYSGSTLCFPERFTGAQRHVELRGEGYFEVAQDAQHPFTVSLEGGSAVQVLGTVFNIKSYDSEHIRTTLLRGAVKVSKGDDMKLLKPGETALVDPKAILIGKADTTEATGWHRDKFVFHQLPVRDVMAELARWYDLNLRYDERYTQQEVRYTGEIGRSVTLDRLLKMLEQTGVGKFELKEKILAIRPY